MKLFKWLSKAIGREYCQSKNLYSKVLELDPNHENANINIGVIFQQLGEFQSAKKCYENVLKIIQKYKGLH